MFTTQCFIRKNTPELREKLEQLGYSPTLNGHGEWFIPMDELPYLETFPMSKSYMGRNGFCDTSLIDCGTNEELFIALAAMRNDSDENQYCIDSEGNWFLYNKPYVRLLSKTNVNWHKATVKELIEQFKE